MTYVARYIASSLVKSSYSKVVAASAVEKDVQQCNYSNNYYGDQVCQPKKC